MSKKDTPDGIDDLPDEPAEPADETSPDQDQAPRLESEAETILQNAESILREFVNTPILNFTTQEGWESRLQININNRLAGTQDKRYLLGLNNSVKSAVPEKEKIIAAAFIYELQNQKEMKAMPSYNQMVLLRLVFNLSKRDRGLVGVTIKKYLSRMPLKDMYEIYQNSRAVKSEDLPNLAEMALERLPQDEAASSQILEKAMRELFGHSRHEAYYPDAKKFLKEDSDGNPNALRFSHKVLNYILEDIYSDNRRAKVIEDVILEIQSRIERNKAMLLSLNSDSIYEINSIKHMERINKELEALLTSLPVLRQAMQKMQKKEKITFVEQAKARKQIDSDKLQEEQTERENLDFARDCVNFETGLTQLFIDESEVDGEIHSKIRNAYSNLHKLDESWEIDLWKIIGNGEKGNAFSLADLEKKLPRPRSNGNWRDARELQQKWYKKKEQLAESARKILASREEQICKTIDEEFNISAGNRSKEDHLIYIDYLQRNLDGIAATLEKNGDGKKIKNFPQSLLNSIKKIIEKKLADIQPAYKEMETLERDEMIKSAQEDYLRELVEKQTGYLHVIYAIGTGLSLAEMEFNASSENGDMIGSVTVGKTMQSRISQALRQTQNQSFKIFLEGEKDNITLEMGEDLETLMQRLAMVNWVAPHEIGHLVDLALDLPPKFFPKEQIDTTNALLEKWKGGNPELARRLLPFSNWETVIDGIGYTMLKRFGTADPLQQNTADRISAAMKGYSATVEVLIYILDQLQGKKTSNNFEITVETENESPEDSLRMKAHYCLTILRNIADGEILLKEAADNQIDQETSESVKSQIKKQKDIFRELNAETGFIDESQIHEIINLFKDSFNRAQQLEWQ